jgi:hypothetical protein
MPAHLAHRPSFCGLLVNERGKAGATPGVQISGFIDEEDEALDTLVAH